MAKQSVLESLYRTPVGHALARRAGLSDPPVLRRGRRLPDGPVALVDLGGAGIVAEAIRQAGIARLAEPVLDLPELRRTDDSGRERAPAYAAPVGAVVIDATAVRTLAELEGVRRALRPALRGVEASGRIIMVGTDADALEGLEAKATAQALDGINRTVGKELRRGATTNLIRLRAGTEAAELRSTVSFLLEGRSAYVNGQTWRVGPPKPGDAPDAGDDPARPFTGRIVAVTGAARGIGAEIARVFARGGASVVLVDVPASGESLARVANEVRGSALHLDVTAADAAQRLTRHVVERHGPQARLWAVVHNAGITRDKLLVNLDERRWAQVLEVNLAAELRMNPVLLDEGVPGALGPRGRIVGIASTSGVAGNRGQANYAASKAGVMGLVWAQAAELRDRAVTVNAVAPGFIETDMTAAIPFVQREVFRRTSSLGQGGLPVDVAETIAYLCEPASGGVDGQIIRVCGQNLVGA